MTESKTFFWKDRRVLITGASGFLGAWLSRLLLESGARVYGFDLSEGVCLRVHGIADQVPVIKGSIMDQQAVEKVLQDQEIEICFHLAGQSMIEDAAAGPVTAFEINVRGTWLVLEACRKTKSIIGVACASSNHTYGPQELFPSPESQSMNQLDVYGASKVCADVIARSFAHNFGMPVVAVRNMNSYGPADSHGTHIITGTILSILKDESPIIRSDGSPVKGYLYAQDTMEAYMLLAENASKTGIRGEAFNITPEEPISVKDLVDFILKVTGKTYLSPVIQSSDLSQKNYFEHLSGEKVTSALGWKPRFSLEEGIRLTYDWYAKNAMDWAKADHELQHS